MTVCKTSAALAAVFAILAATTATAQTTGHEQHHPAATPSGDPAAAAAPESAVGMPMMAMMCREMMRQTMMPRDGMMGHGRMGGVMTGRVEGRIAFLKAELKITEAQQQLWNDVADAIRANAAVMSKGPGGRMATGNSGGTVPEKLAARDRALSARVDALRKYRAALDPLYAAFSDQQKQTAEELLTIPIGMMGMGAM